MEGKLLFLLVIRQEVNNILYFWASINKIRYYDNDTGQRVACLERHYGSANSRATGLLPDRFPLSETGCGCFHWKRYIGCQCRRTRCCDHTHCQCRCHGTSDFSVTFFHSLLLLLLVYTFCSMIINFTQFFFWFSM